MPAAPARVLIIDDQPLDAELASSLLRCRLESVAVTVAGDPLGFADGLAAGAFDLVICEQRLAWGQGLSILETVKRLYPDCPLLFLSNLSDPTFELKAARLGVSRCLVKGSAGFLQLPLVAGELLGRQPAWPGPVDSGGSLIERLPVGVFTLTPEGRLRCLNQACRQIFRLEDKVSAEPPRLEELLADETAKASVADAIERRQALRELDLPLSGPQGPSAWVRFSLWPVGNKAAGGGWEGVVADVSVYVQALSQLSRNAEELGRSNADLEKFAQAASHDLKEPLGRMSSYAQLFSDQYRDKLDESGQRYLTQILDSSARLQRMVGDALAYSRMDSVGGDFAPVDFGAIADAAAGTLDGAFREAGASYERSGMPVLNADARQIHQLFQGLFSNALKFRGAEPLLVRVAAEPRDGHWLFSVKDNGIGIELTATERVFGMFQRPGTGDQDPGKGIGLAVCRGIVERHGGAIWVDSEPGHGSTFFFTCSKALATAPIGQGATT